MTPHSWDPTHRDWKELATARTEGIRRPQALADLYETALRELGEDPTRQGLQKTPYRVSKAMLFLTSGYYMDVRDVLNDALFDSPAEEMVVVRNIEYYSLCEHHLIPFFGRVHVAYLPGGKVVGLSKVPRIVDVFARRLQVQETMTEQIAQALMEHLNPRGVGVVSTGFHLCMAMRGVEKQGSSTVASAMYGAFRDDARTRSEFLALISPDLGR